MKIQIAYLNNYMYVFYVVKTFSVILEIFLKKVLTWFCFGDIIVTVSASYKQFNKRKCWNWQTG